MRKGDTGQATNNHLRIDPPSERYSRDFVALRPPSPARAFRARGEGEWVAAALPLSGDYALVQARYGVERGEYRAFLPGGEIGTVFAGEKNVAVHGAEVAVMLGARRF